MVNHNSKWTAEELAFIEANCKTMRYKELAEKLGTKTVGAIRNKVSDMGWASKQSINERKGLGQIGDRHGRLVIVGPLERVTKWGKVYLQVSCRCDCGSEKLYLLTELTRGKITGCGCRDGTPLPKVGDVIGRLTINEIYTEKRHNQNASYAKVTCVCGVQKDKVLLTSIHRGRVQSCGCLKAQKSSARITAMSTKHNMTKTRLYRVWAAMKTRGTNPNATGAHNYFGRGINVCEEWLAFEPFRDWALANGYSDDLTLDRRDNDKGYGPDNCRWATRQVQGNNKRSNRLVEAFGETKTVADWCRDPRCVVRYQVFFDRIHVLQGWSAELAMTTPAGLPGRPMGRKNNPKVVPTL